tara:strand:- start:5173 stop:5463 length:291 start_codon:yes stop_codon:yes gene_type:complete
MKEYHNIIFLQDTEEASDLINQLLDGQYEAVLKHLAQWDYGPEMEHSPTEGNMRPWGYFDRTIDFPAYDEWTYTISYCGGHGYVALTRWKSCTDEA